MSFNFFFYKYGRSAANEHSSAPTFPSVIFASVLPKCNKYLHLQLMPPLEMSFFLSIHQDQLHFLVYFSVQVFREPVSHEEAGCERLFSEVAKS